MTMGQVLITTGSSIRLPVFPIPFLGIPFLLLCPRTCPILWPLLAILPSRTSSGPNSGFQSCSWIVLTESMFLQERLSRDYSGVLLRWNCPRRQYLTCRRQLRLRRVASLRGQSLVLSFLPLCVQPGQVLRATSCLCTQRVRRSKAAVVLGLFFLPLQPFSFLSPPATACMRPVLPGSLRRTFVVFRLVWP